MIRERSAKPLIVSLILTRTSNFMSKIIERFLIALELRKIRLSLGVPQLSTTPLWWWRMALSFTFTGKCNNPDPAIYKIYGR